MAIHGGTVSEAAIERVSQLTRVVMMADVAGPAHASVRVDNGSLGVLTRHLLADHGYRRLAFVGNPAGSPDVTARWEAFLAAHLAVHLPAPEEPIRVGLQQSDGAIAASALLDGGDPPEAVVCANDEIALGLMISALSRGLRVPGALAITGFDDIAMAPMVQLTTVRQPIRELAKTTARMLRDPVTQVSGDLVLASELLLRGSCGCRAEGVPPLADIAPGSSTVAVGPDHHFIDTHHGPNTGTAAGTTEHNVAPGETEVSPP
jgi:LacI family transcriptional regulator